MENVFHWHGEDKLKVNIWCSDKHHVQNTQAKDTYPEHKYLNHAGTTLSEINKYNSYDADTTNDDTDIECKTGDNRQAVDIKDAMVVNTIDDSDFDQLINRDCCFLFIIVCYVSINANMMIY